MDDDRDQHRPERDRERHAGINPAEEHAGHRCLPLRVLRWPHVERPVAPGRRERRTAAAHRPIRLTSGGEAPERARTASGARRRDFRSVRRAGIGRAQRCVASTILPLASRRRSRCIASAARSSGNVSEITGRSAPSSNQAKSRWSESVMTAGSCIRYAPQKTPTTLTFFTSTKPAGTWGMSPVAKPMTSSRPSHAMQRIDWAKTSPPTDRRRRRPRARR